MNDLRTLIKENIPLEIWKNGLENKKVVIFGTGGDGIRTYSMLRQYNIENISFCDNNPEKWGKKVGQTESICISITDIPKYSDAIFIIGTRNYVMPIAQQLKSLNVTFLTSDAYLFLREINKLEEVYKIFLNSESQNVYYKLIETMVTGNFNIIPEIYSDKQYYAIPQFAMPKANDVFIDCGAYVGDSIEQFINIRMGNFGKIFSFEPCSKQFNAMIKRRDRLISEWALEEDKITCIKAGLSDSKGEKYLDVCGSLGESFINNKNDTTLDEKIEIISLDEYFKDFREHISFIKADIEGYELKMLHGARNIIQKDKPNLAICIYHKFNDFFEIPLFIKTLVPEYKMEVRHHNFNLWETVLYCYI